MTAMKTLYIAQASGSIDYLRPLILRAYDRAAITVKRDLDLAIETVDVIFIDDASMTIEEIGVGGFTPKRHLCYIYLDSSKDVSEDEIYYTLCHELHHAKRYEGEGYGSTLFDSIIFEGLATAYEAQVSSGSSYVVKTLQGRNSTEQLIASKYSHFSDESFDHYKWFIAGDGDTLPTWTGYEIGYYLARAYSENEQKKASQLVLEKTELFQGVVRDTLRKSSSS